MLIVVIYIFVITFYDIDSQPLGHDSFGVKTTLTQGRPETIRKLGICVKIQNSKIIVYEVTTEVIL